MVTLVGLERGPSKRPQRLEQACFPANIALKHGKSDEIACNLSMDIPIPVTKICSTCHTPKPLTCFRPDSRYSMGVRGQCLDCTHHREQRWRDANKKETNKRHREYHKANPHKKKEYYQQNKIELLRKGKERIKKDPTKERNRLREYWNRPENAARKEARRKERIKSDPSYKALMICRGRLQSALSRIGVTKSGRTHELLGCSPVKLRTHIESLWQPGMIWDNHGTHKHGKKTKWHVDHIVPCAAFDLSDPVQQRHCFHWSNLQPLWGVDNILKRDTIAPTRYWDDTLGRWMDRSVEPQPAQPHRSDDQSTSQTDARQSCASPLRPYTEPETPQV